MTENIFSFHRINKYYFLIRLCYKKLKILVEKEKEDLVLCSILLDEFMGICDKEYNETNYNDIDDFHRFIKNSENF